MSEKRKGGFASLTPEQRKEIARKGGIAAHKKGKGHQWTKEEAAAAGKLGGIAAAAKRTKPENVDDSNNENN